MYSSVIGNAMTGITVVCKIWYYHLNDGDRIWIKFVSFIIIISYGNDKHSLTEI
jgi:hypothetical protein